MIAGQGTVGLELAAQAKAEGAALDAVVVCCGGGGLTAGCALALKETAPDLPKTPKPLARIRERKMIHKLNLKLKQCLIIHNDPLKREVKAIHFEGMNLQAKKRRLKDIRLISHPPH